MHPRVRAVLGTVDRIRARCAVCPARRPETFVDSGSAHASLFAAAHQSIYCVSDGLPPATAAVSRLPLQYCLPLQLCCLWYVVTLLPASFMHPAADCDDCCGFFSSLPAADRLLQSQRLGLLGDPHTLDQYRHGPEFLESGVRNVFRQACVECASTALMDSHPQPRIHPPSRRQGVCGVCIGVVDLSCLNWLCYDGCTKAKEKTL